MRPRISLGGWGWVGIAGVVTVVDGVALHLEATGRVIEAPTMSRSFFLATRHPVRRWPVLVSWLVLTVHLFTTWNDPIRRLAGRVQRAMTGNR